ncbi:TonB-dependent receptor [uncultured Sunxiuqinia sp.]|uniref:TonB-dependent receptor n=1 Tax=uncultured Sunxiuqinia sp. TaxID=1573825 RepID=UPI0030D799CE|tara:strand:- start:2379 stop:4763 length:2385 start_codon:yes stop_codon:yes gene_type:complete
MRTYFIAAMLLFSLPIVLYAQENSVLHGIVLDENSKPLPGCHVHYHDLFTITDFDGGFAVESVGEERLLLQFSFIGYAPKDTLISNTNRDLVIQLQPAVQNIGSVLVKSNRTDAAKSLKNEVITQEFLTRNMGGTFIKSLDQISGVNTMDIGANASKPVIRGLSFNRVVVSENGIKQEGQQWGADHGLEMDPFAVETGEVVKGPSAIEYGSDAIGGYVHIKNDRIPEDEEFNAQIQLLTKSVNHTLAVSTSAEGRKNRFFFKLRGTVLDFGDYHIPTDTIVYLTQKMPVANKYLKNTAGQEFDLSGHAGLVYNRFRTTASLSRVSQKSGFFPGSHGIPSQERVKDDGNRRNIEYPRQQVEHVKLVSNNRYSTRDASIHLDVGFQNNNRSEWSEFHTHYPGQEAPENNPDKELEFRLKTYQVNLKTSYRKWKGHQLTAGAQNQWKNNRVGGYNFLLPRYDNYTVGAFLKDAIQISPNVQINLAIRYDWARIRTTALFDSILFDYLGGTGVPEDEASAYASRSDHVNRSFHDVSWLMGVFFTASDRITGRFNLGKAFRTPTAIELTANGIHHGSFRHEQGNSMLASEKGYYADASLEWKNERIEISFSPYLYFFSNYLYLDPSGEWSKLPHAGQVYKYTQSKAVLSGFEFSVHQLLFQKLELRTNVEYIRNKQFVDTKNSRYPLPFTPPSNAFAEAEYKFRQPGKKISDVRIFINTKVALDQNRVARNEQNTPGYQIVGAGFSAKIETASNPVELILQAHNLFDATYFNHISFYRKLEIPEPGRNIQLLIKIPVSL